jgi:hypothetical protein
MAGICRRTLLFLLPVDETTIADWLIFRSQTMSSALSRLGPTGSKACRRGEDKQLSPAGRGATRCYIFTPYFPLSTPQTQVHKHHFHPSKPLHVYTPLTFVILSYLYSSLITSFHSFYDKAKTFIYKKEGTFYKTGLDCLLVIDSTATLSSSNTTSSSLSDALPKSSMGTKR